MGQYYYNKRVLKHIKKNKWNFWKIFTKKLTRWNFKIRKVPCKHSLPPMTFLRQILTSNFTNSQFLKKLFFLILRKAMRPADKVRSVACFEEIYHRLLNKYKCMSAWPQNVLTRMLSTTPRVCALSVTILKSMKLKKDKNDKSAPLVEKGP